MTPALRSARFASDLVLQQCLAGAAVLQTGATGGAVQRVQQALMALGYTLREYGPDGVFGAETAEAVAAFNAHAGVDSEGGVAGRATIAALDERLAPEPPELAGRAAHQGTSVIGNPWAPRSAEEAAACAKRAVDLALAEAAAGAHFLTGAAGGIPGEHPVTLAPARTDPVAPAVFAAECEAQERHRCVGRFDARNGGVAGGRPAMSTDTDLIVYLAGLASLPEAQWKPFFRFFSPRRSDDADLGGRVLWGEDCRGKRHFDGPGLINWCLEQATGATTAIALDLAGWATDDSPTEAVPMNDPPCAGDIVLRAVDATYTHIGFLAGSHVVLAEQPSVGVVTRRFSPAGWTIRRRLAPAGPRPVSPRRGRAPGS